MNIKAHEARLLIIPVGNLLALASLLIFGLQGLTVSLAVMFLYHALLSARGALMGDLTLYLTLLPMTRILASLYDVALGSYLWAFPVMSIVLTFLFLFVPAQAARLTITHSLK